MSAFEAIDNVAIALRLEHVAGFTADLRHAVGQVDPGDGFPALFARRDDGTFTHQTLPPLEGLDQVDTWISNRTPARTFGARTPRSSNRRTRWKRIVAPEQS